MINNIPWYLNWPFWTATIAVVNIILSQIPPIRVLIKKAKIELDLYSKISITHKIGNPNLQLHLIISNIGGRKIKIKGVEATLEKDGKELIKLPAQNYFQNQTDKNTVLFTKIFLEPGTEWAYIVNFLNFFNGEQEREYLGYEKKILANYRAKKEGRGDDDKTLIELDPLVVEPFHAFFKKHFIWAAGEYTLTVNITTDKNLANLEKKYRFTIFESHEEQIKAATEGYKYGDGIWWNGPKQTNVVLELKEL